MNIIGLIPARSGSKRVRNKNVKLLANKPLIAYTIEQALKSEYIQRVIVSTDSDEIKTIALSYGAEAPFIRPVELSGDNSTEYEFHMHCLDWLNKNENYQPDLIVNLYPTSPFKKFSTIDSAIVKFLNASDADSLRSVRKCSEHPYKMWVQNDDYLKPFVETKNENDHTLSYQMLPSVYIQNACIYITKPETLKQYRSTVGKKVLSFLMDDIESTDINSDVDFKFAEYLLSSGYYGE